MNDYMVDKFLEALSKGVDDHLKDLEKLKEEFPDELGCKEKHAV